MSIRLCDFVEPELDELRAKCNFTDDELAFFNLRAKGKTLIEISASLHISERKADTLSARVRQKIHKS